MEEPVLPEVLKLVENPPRSVRGYDVLTWYDELGSGYDELYLEEQLSKYEVIASRTFLKEVTGSVRVVLDVGCGTGGMIAFLKSLQTTAIYVGLDLSPSMCELTRKRLNELSVLGDVVAGDLLTPPFRDCTADLVLSITVVTCGRSLKDNIENLYRITKNGGSLIYTVLCSSGTPDVDESLCGLRIWLSSRELLCVSSVQK